MQNYGIASRYFKLNLKKTVLIILGPPGSGKGTQAKMLAQKYRMRLFGTGDLMRDGAKNGEATALEMKKYWEEGNLVPDELVNLFVEEKLKSLAPKDLELGLICDGCPRTLVQAEVQDKIFKNLGLDETLAVNIDVSDASIVERLKARKICENCKKIFLPPESLNLKKCDECQGNLIVRDDDKPEVVKHRLKIYREQTAPLIQYYRERNKLIEVNGESVITVVFNEIISKIEDYFSQ